MLEYLATSATVAVGWSGYFGNFLASLGISVPHAFASAPIAANATGHMIMTGALFNLPAMLLVGFVTTFLVIGVKTSANFNNVMVATSMCGWIASMGRSNLCARNWDCSQRRNSSGPARESQDSKH